MLLGALLLPAGCSQTQIDFVCEVPGEAVVCFGNKEYKLPETITFTGERDDLLLKLPTPSGGQIRAKGEIKFYSTYQPTDVDKYARLRAVIARDLIEIVEDGGAAVFTGYSASEQKVFRLLFGKE